MDRKKRICCSLHCNCHQKIGRADCSNLTAIDWKYGVYITFFNRENWDRHRRGQWRNPLLCRAQVCFCVSRPQLLYSDQLHSKLFSANLINFTIYLYYQIKFISANSIIYILFWKWSFFTDFYYYLLWDECDISFFMYTYTHKQRFYTKTLACKWAAGDLHLPSCKLYIIQTADFYYSECT